MLVGIAAELATPRFRSELNVAYGFVLVAFAVMACVGVWIGLNWRNVTEVDLDRPRRLMTARQFRTMSWTAGSPTMNRGWAWSMWPALGWPMRRRSSHAPPRQRQYARRVCPVRRDPRRVRQPFTDLPRRSLAER